MRCVMHRVMHYAMHYAMQAALNPENTVYDSKRCAK